MNVLVDVRSMHLEDPETVTGAVASLVSDSMSD